MVNRCLACGHKKTDYSKVVVGIYFVCAWIFAIEVLVMVLQYKII